MKEWVVEYNDIYMDVVVDADDKETAANKAEDLIIDALKFAQNNGYPISIDLDDCNGIRIRELRKP